MFYIYILAINLPLLYNVNMKDFDLFIEDLKNLIAIPSVAGTPEKDAPFGKEVRTALDCFLEIAERLGFKTINHEGYMGELSFGEGEEIGIIGHLDVVPVGHGWNSPPFTLTEKDGIYYGRGVIDDKSPLLLCLYALKELKDSKIKPKKKFRLFVGCNEESGWGDVEYFKTKSSFPEYGFSPDGDFPVTYAEKGISHVTFTLKKPKGFANIKGGTAINCVCDLATAMADKSVIDKNLLKKYSLSLDDNNTIISRGKAAHGSTPELGVNAIKPLLQYMNEFGGQLEEGIDVLFNDSLGLGKTSSDQGKITFSPNLIKDDKENLYITCDCRIPYPYNDKTVCDILNKSSLTYSSKIANEPAFVDKNCSFVQSLLKAYNTVTGQNKTPVSIGGSTFARAFKFGCSFGAAMGSNNNMHDANEYISKAQLLECYAIYKQALFNLATEN